MTVWNLIQELGQCEADAVVHFKLDMDKETIQVLAEEDANLFREPLSLDEILDDGTDVDINLSC